MDPVEERDVLKVLEMLDDPRVIEKIAGKLTALGDSILIIVPKKNVVEVES